MKQTIGPAAECRPSDRLCIRCASGSVTLLSCLWLLAGPASSAPAPSAAPTSTGAQVAVPKLPPLPGDVIAPLPKGSPLPSSDPRNLEGIWVGLGRAITEDGAPPPFLPEVAAERKRRMDLEMQGKPVVAKGTLCRPPGMVAIDGNQFPTQILQRPEKILIIAEEHRGVWPVYMTAELPKNPKPAYVGHNIGHWEGNTLVIDSIGLIGKAVSGFGVAHSKMTHVVTRITKANTGDKLNGDRLVIERRIEDPTVYRHAWTSTNVARWRPDVEMLEFNCEESPTELTADGLVVE